MVAQDMATAFRPRLVHALVTLTQQVFGMGKCAISTVYIFSVLISASLRNMVSVTRTEAVIATPDGPGGLAKILNASPPAVHPIGVNASWLDIAQDAVVRLVSLAMAARGKSSPMVVGIFCTQTTLLTDSTVTSGRAPQLYALMDLRRLSPLTSRGRVARVKNTTSVLWKRVRLRSVLSVVGMDLVLPVLVIAVLDGGNATAHGHSLRLLLLLELNVRRHALEASVT